MGFTHTFIERPILAAVLSILITIVGAIAYFALPVTQYPEVAPPTIQVSATYPGASAETVSQTVATPLEQEINGVEGMLYMESQSTGDGRMTLTITFELGTDLDLAQVLVQNRVSIAEPRLPEAVRRLGVVTRKNSPDLMMVVHLLSPDETYDQLYISNYAVLQIRDALARIDGVGQIQVFGASEYAMRVWLDPDLVASVGLTAEQVVASLRGQNVQVASGTLNEPPNPAPGAFQIGIQTQGRLSEPEEFGNLVVKAEEDGRVVRVRDVGRVELGAQDYVNASYLDGKPAVALLIFQRPGSNALQTADAIIRQMDDFATDFPDGLEHSIVYNPTEFVQQSIDEVIRTLFEAVLLVVLVIILFLQSWRASIIPIVAIPVSLIGTFSVLGALGFSLNNLSLFGLVLAIGIVVDDAIIVVENIARKLGEGRTPKQAAHETMDEVGGALVATSLVLVAVFLPTAFIEGISGAFYRQFAITIAIATLISTFVSLTLSPALSAVLLSARDGQSGGGSTGALAWFFDQFNRGLSRLSEIYGGWVTKLVRMGAIVLVVYGGLILLTAFQFNRVPGGFIPAQDQGYFIVSIQLPSGASLSRTDDVLDRVVDILLETNGIEHAVGFAGFSGATFTNAPNAGAVFPTLVDFSERGALGVDYASLMNEVRQKLSAIDEAFIVVLPPPPVRGIGNAGGFKMMIQDRRGRGIEVLDQAVFDMAQRANQMPGLVGVFSFYETNTPQIYLDIDRTRAEKLNVPVENVFSALEVYFGSAFVNDFNYLGRTYRVTAQADAPFRLTEDDILRLRTSNANGDVVPIGSVATLADTSGPYRQPRFNLYPAAAINGDTLPGFSSGQAIAAMEELAEELPDGLSYEWTELAFQQKQAGNTAALVFVLAVLFVFLLLAGQYESWLLPASVILIVPMCLLSAISGIALVGLDNNILVQIGFVVLIGLACKNAILIVEFAKSQEDEGRDRFAAAVEAAKLRLRPILMTSFAFILGVVPLVVASGAGAEMRQALGITVFSGMLGVTFFGLLLTPVFYVLMRSLAVRQGRQATERRTSAT